MFLDLHGGVGRKDGGGEGGHRGNTSRSPFVLIGFLPNDEWKGTYDEEN